VTGSAREFGIVRIEHHWNNGGANADDR